MFFDGGVLAPNSPVIPTSVAVAIVSAYVLDYLKRLNAIPQVSYYTSKLNTWLRVVMSGLGTLGVGWSWSAAGTGHQLLITIPAWTVLGFAIWHWAIAFAMQHLAEIQLAQRQVAKQAMLVQSVGPSTPKATVLQQDVGPSGIAGLKAAEKAK